MYEIAIADCQEVLLCDDHFLRKVAERVLACERVASATLSVALVDNQTIHKLNRDFLDHDHPTDVLSFLLESNASAQPELTGGTPPLRRGEGKSIEGEVIISTETALQAAEELGCPPEEELALYLVHGILHLLGYDDRTAAERELMRRREREILEGLSEPAGRRTRLFRSEPGGAG